MGNTILDRARANQSLEDCRKALRDIGLDVSDIEDLGDVAKAIRKDCVTGPNAVFNATLQSGPGIKITPVERQGYKISSNSEATLAQDLSDDLPRGTSVHKTLHHIIYHLIPNAIQEAIENPGIVGIETFKAQNDGIDYYDNRFFGKKGKGRKTGLHPHEWYIKIYTTSSAEPLYVGMGDMLADFKRQLMFDIAHQTERQIEIAMQTHDNKCHGGMFKPNKPGKPGHPCPSDCERPQKPEQDRPQCPECDADFPEDLDPDFGVDSEPGKCPECDVETINIFDDAPVLDNGIFDMLDKLGGK